MVTARRSDVERARLVGLVLLVLLALGWGVNWTMMKIALREVPPWTFRAWSSLLAGAALLALARARRQRLMPSGREWRWLSVAALFNITLWHAAVAYSLILIASSHAALIGYTMPLWVAVISAVVLRQRLSARIVLAVALGMTGILALISGDFAAILQSKGGSLLMLMGALSWATGTVVLKSARFSMGTLAVTAWQLLIGGVPMLILALALERGEMPALSGAAIWAWAYMILIGSIFCYAAWFRLVELLPAPVAALSSLLTPVVGVLSGVLFLGEPLGAREAVALLAILGALILVSTRSTPAPVPSGKGAVAGAEAGRNISDR